MILAVFDCGVIISALGWNGNPRFCLVYAGQVDLWVTAEIWEEYDEKVPVVLGEHQREVDAEAELARLLTVAHFTAPAVLGKPRSRDPHDDRYVAAALASHAAAIVSNDRDLLALGSLSGFQS